MNTAEALAKTGPEGLLDAYAALTHQMHGAADDTVLRAQRTLVRAEILRRITDQ